MKKNINGANQLRLRLDTIKAAKGVAGLRERLSVLWPEFSLSKLTEMVIVGAAGEGLRLAALCSSNGIAIRAIVDDDSSKHGMSVEGIKVANVDTLNSIPREIPVIVASHRSLLPVRRLRAMGFKTVSPFMTLQMLDPVSFPPHMFHDGLLEDLAVNLHQYEALENVLADDVSRAVLAAVIGYRMDGDPEILSPVVEWDLYGPNNLLNYGSDEVYVDGGAFDGDSIKLFIERVKGRYSRVLGFEPDPATFARLKNTFINEPKVEPINAGLHKKEGILRFDDAGTRGSILVESGGISVPVVGLDEVLQGDRVSYIKMNIEGAEIDALQGGADSIKRWGPKLAISAYHLPNHLWKIPLEISKIREDYQIFFRQHDGGIIETVVFALPISSKIKS
jgi:FkbM family methyltransferase